MPHKLQKSPKQQMNDSIADIDNLSLGDLHELDGLSEFMQGDGWNLVEEEEDPEVRAAEGYMLHSPIYFRGGEIHFYPDGIVRVLYNKADRDIESHIEEGKDDEERGVIALELWRAINTVHTRTLNVAMRDLRCALKKPKQEIDEEQVVRETLYELAKRGGYGKKRGKVKKALRRVK